MESSVELFAKAAFVVFRLSSTDNIDGSMSADTQLNKFLASENCRVLVKCVISITRGESCDGSLGKVETKAGWAPAPLGAPWPTP